MAGSRVPAGSDRYREPIDPGTGALIATPPPTGLVKSPTSNRAFAIQPPAEVPLKGSVLAATGLPSAVRISVPGTGGLCIEFTPRGWQPASGSTSTLFFQEVSGKRHLRLDYGYNVRTKSINYHWNQVGTFNQFDIADHAVVGRAGAVTYHAAKYFRYAGRVLLVGGAIVDGISIVQADRPLRRATQVVAAWAAAYAGCKLVGADGAALGSLASPFGTAAGGIAGCIIGGYAAYEAGSVAAGEVFDWAEGTLFKPLPETQSP